jgi:acyl transferase domain-containing protein/aryl carrier-like protein
MADQTKPLDSSELLKRALAAIDQLQAKLAATEAAKHEPIAIVGMGCRFAGASNPDELWRNLMEGVDSVTEVPPYRWDANEFFDPDPDAIGKAYTKWGGFIGDVEHFDAPFFGITPREAITLDPHQRVLLETVWAALEDANIAPSTLSGTKAGVFIGMSSIDYVQILTRVFGQNGDAYIASGTSHSIAGGRLSYFLGTHGPNITVDTACSSSLVAVHLGMKSLRSGESNFVLAGGVNLTLLPEASIITSRARMMSATGRCNTFDESADGYVRAEGCGMIAMKRLSDAQRDGDRILALLRGSALNQDGRSSGLTAPHGPSQEAVVREALADSGLTPDDVTFVEAHGTGTSLGDPIEVGALANVFAGRGEDRPLVIGSLKANIGHTEPTAGIAGLIKAVQALRHRVMPKQIHLHNPNPLIDWTQTAIKVPLENAPLSAPAGKKLICGVSSFGFSGTNSHVILEEAPAAPTAKQTPHAADSSTLLTFSGRSADAVNALAGRYADLLESANAPSLRDIAAAAPHARSHFAERAGVVAADAADAIESLRAMASGANAPNVVRGRTLSAATPEIVFLFTGQGAQYAGMGKALYEIDAAFRGAIDQCDALAKPHLGRSLKDIMFGLNGAGDLVDDTTYTQPALFAIEYALAQAWRAWGVEPTAVMGHSVGEYAAATVAGMLSLEDAIRLISTRGALMGGLPRGGGGMAAVFATEDIVRAAIAPAGNRLSVAAVNGPTNIVISGAADALAEAGARLAASGVEMQTLNVSHAFHSSVMDPILDEFERVASDVHFAEPQITLMSNISGARMGAEGRRADYWRRHLREAVRFSDSIAGLQREGYRVFLELGPAPILTGMAQRCASAAEPGVYISSLRKGRDDRRSMLEAAGRLYGAGAKLDWDAIVGAAVGHTALPSYPFQRTRFWPAETSVVPAVTAGLSGVDTGHPLLGNRAATATEIYQTQLGVGAQAWARDHRLFDLTPFPAAGFLELALAAARESAGPQAQVENFVIGQGLMLPDSGNVDVQVTVSADASGAKSLQIYSAEAGEAGAGPTWRLHASANISTAPSSANAPDTALEGGQVITAEAYYETLQAAGANYGPAFRGVRAIKRNGRQVVAEVALPEGVAADKYVLHPALLDACMQLMGVGMQEGDEPSKDLFMPISAGRYYVARPGATAATCRVSVEGGAAGAKTYAANFSLHDQDGALIAELQGFEVRKITRAALEKVLHQSGPRADWCFGVDWRLAEMGATPADLADQNWIVFADKGGSGAAFADELRTRGASAILIEHPEKLDEKQIAAAVAKAAPIDRPLHGAALLWPLDAPTEFAGGASVEAATLSQTEAALYAVRSVVDRAARVLVVTRGAQQVENRDADLVQSAVWAFAGVVAIEHPTCGLTRVDLDPSARGDDANSILTEAMATDREDRVAYRAGQRYLARLTPAKLAPEAELEPVELDISERGSLGNLAFAPLARPAPADNEIEIRVRATGLNFRDVLNALGMYEGGPIPLGVECAGVVTAIGAKVTLFKVGDDVVAMADRTFATYALAPEAMCVQKPAHITYQEAATVPVTFLTADYALRALSGLKAGDRVLVHAVTGGVGMAAAQLALRAGAIVYGTAGTPAKRRLAKSLGVQFVSDSRSLSFIDDIMRDTKGEGVDIALNSLAGEFIPATLGLVRKGGHFVEIGKTDIWDAKTVAEKFPDVRYHPLFLGEIAAEDQNLMRAMLDETLADMRPGGPLRPLPQTVFDLNQAEQAFRYMAQGLHTGKVVLTQHQAARARADGVYVITGGLTGLGLTTGEWLANQGAGGLVLLGRRAPSDEAQASIRAMEAAGAKVRVAQVDVTDAAALAKLLDDVRANLGPIRGVMHAAGVLDDGMLSEQTAERFARVMAPKVSGGWALHELTLTDPLDFFVLFSSAAALFGSPGQSNYAAANGFLDGLAAYRQARGLPGVAINWGSWADVGMAAGVNADHHRRWAAMGLEMITPESGMDMLGDVLLKADRPQIAAVPLVRARFPTNVAAFYRELAGDAAVSDDGPSIDVMSELRTAEPDARRGVLETYVADQVRRALALPGAQKVDVHESLLNLGMDSLMAMELRNRLQGAVGVRVAVADLLEGASTVDVARMLLAEIVIDAPKGAAASDVEWEEGQI